MVLSCENDGLGRKTYFSSSDNKCTYFYTYDPMGNLLEVKDLVTHQKTSRDYDSHGRVILDGEKGEDVK